MKKLSGADQQLIEAIHRDPGHVLSHYARPLGISPQLALFIVERLIARGEVKRHSHTEKLSLPVPAATATDTSKPSAADDVPAFITGWYRDTPRRRSKPVSASELQSMIVELLKTGNKTTRELADSMHRKAPGIGGALHALRERGLITSSGSLGNKSWRLLETGAEPMPSGDELVSVPCPEINEAIRLLEMNGYIVRHAAQVVQ
jgi:DNA-binding MarR family transcriptional regulator